MLLLCCVVCLEYPTLLRYVNMHVQFCAHGYLHSSPPLPASTPRPSSCLISSTSSSAILSNCDDRRCLSVLHTATHSQNSERVAGHVCVTTTNSVGYHSTYILQYTEQIGKSTYYNINIIIVHIIIIIVKPCMILSRFEINIVQIHLYCCLYPMWIYSLYPL